LRKKRQQKSSQAAESAALWQVLFVHWNQSNRKTIKSFIWKQ